MAKKSGHRSDRDNQRHQLRAEGDKAFLFDPEVTACLAEFSREDWEFAIDLESGNAAAAARHCGFEQAPAGCKALWGSSAAQAQEAYRAWQKRASKKG